MSTPLTAPLAACEDALAADPNYLAWSGAVDAADAKANYIFTDDVIDGASTPDRFACSSAVRMQISRIGDGSGAANFGLSDLNFDLLFVEMLPDGTDWSNALRVAFKDTIYGFIDAFVTSFETEGVRLQSIALKEYNEEFRMHIVDPDTGQLGYQMAWQVVSRVL